MRIILTFDHHWLLPILYLVQLLNGRIRNDIFNRFFRYQELTVNRQHHGFYNQLSRHAPAPSLPKFLIRNLGDCPYSLFDIED
ncbi:hypothetical protein D3C73_1452200 [compost metagenome]